ncbi:hypothetical protein Tco_0483499 [Tanacetum coccineum]
MAERNGGSKKRHFAEERAKAKRNKPMTQSQLRIYMPNYLKNQGTWKLSSLKKLQFEEIKEEFDKWKNEMKFAINYEADEKQAGIMKVIKLSSSRSGNRSIRRIEQCGIRRIGDFLDVGTDTPYLLDGYGVLRQWSFDSSKSWIRRIGVDITAKTRRPQPRSNTKNDRVPSASKSSCIKNKEVKVEEHHRNLLLSKNKEHMSSECNNVKLAIQNDKSEVICAM